MRCLWFFVFLLFQIFLITWIFILLIDILSFSDLFLPYSLSCRAHPPQTGILQVALRQGSCLCCVGFILNQSNLCTSGTIVLVDDTCWLWDRWLILYVYIYVENRCSSFISSWHLKYFFYWVVISRSVLSIWWS